MYIIHIIQYVYGIYFTVCVQYIYMNMSRYTWLRFFGEFPGLLSISRIRPLSLRSLAECRALDDGRHAIGVRAVPPVAPIDGVSTFLSNVQHGVTLRAAGSEVDDGALQVFHTQLR